MLGFMYKTYVPSRGLFWDGQQNNLSYVYDKEEALTWFSKYEKKFKPFVFTIPPKEKVTVNIPLVTVGEDEERPKEDMEVEKSLYSSKTDPILRAVMERLLKYVYVTKEGVFVSRGEGVDRYMDSQNMEKLQSMKDIMMGLFRITPIQINVGNKKEPKYIDWVIGSNTEKKVTYLVNGTEYSTHMFGIYASNFRKKMFQNSDEMNFYGGHALEYRQRDARLRSGYVTSIAACRNLGKTLLVHHEAALHLVRERVFKSDLNQKFSINYFGLDLRGLAEYMDYIIQMFHNLLGGTFEKETIRNILKVDKTTTDLSLRFFDGPTERILRYISQNQESRGLRSVLGINDEGAHQKTDASMDFLLGAGFAPVWDISTIKHGMQMNEFYKRWAKSFVQTKQYKPIDEIIHGLRIKYGFDKCTKPEDYLAMAKNGVFDLCRAELFKELPAVGLKYTIDQAEHYTQEQRDLIINTALEKHGYDYMMAELFSELTGSSPAIRFMHTISPNKPEKYDKIFIGYDEAEDFDEAGIVAIGVASNKAYVIHSERLPTDIDAKFKEFKAIVALYSSKCKEVVIFADCTRGGAVKREVYDRVGQLNYAVKWTRGKNEDTANVTKEYLLLGKSYVVNLLNEELFLKDRIVIHDSLDVDNGLTRELQLFVKRKGEAYGASSGKDDQVCALLLAGYGVYEYLKQNIVRSQEFEGSDEETIEARLNRKREAIASAENDAKFHNLIGNIR